MSLLWADGFENSSLWSRHYALTMTGHTTATSRSGSGNCMKLDMENPTPDGITWNFPSADAHATVVVGFAVQMNASGTFPSAGSNQLLSFYGDSGATQHGGLFFSDGTNNANITAVRGTTPNLGTSSGIVLTAGIWYYLECKWILHDTTGSVVVKINGVTILNLTNVDTKNGGTNATIDAVRINSKSSAGSNGVLIDDLYILTGAGSVYNDFLGDITVETIRPDGNGNSSQWVGSDSNSTDNYLLVDEATYDSADYVQSGTTNNKDLYTYGALTAASGSVKGVVAKSIMQRTASGAQSARMISRVASTNYNGSSKTLTTSDVLHHQVWEQNPNTAADWTIGEVNGAEFGVEVL